MLTLKKDFQVLWHLVLFIDDEVKRQFFKVLCMWLSKTGSWMRKAKQLSGDSFYPLGNIHQAHSSFSGSERECILAQSALLFKG